MLPEQWCSFETELERVILETKSSTNGDTKNDEGKYCFKEKQFFINPLVRVKVKKSKSELKHLCRFVEEVGKKVNVALALECIVEYCEKGMWSLKEVKYYCFYGFLNPQ